MLCIGRYDNDMEEELDELKFWSDAKEWSDEGKKSSDSGRMMADAPTFEIPHFQTFLGPIYQTAGQLVHWYNFHQIWGIHFFIEITHVR